MYKKIYTDAVMEVVDAVAVFIAASLVIPSKAVLKVINALSIWGCSGLFCIELCNALKMSLIFITSSAVQNPSA